MRSNNRLIIRGMGVLILGSSSAGVPWAQSVSVGPAPRVIVQWQPATTSESAARVLSDVGAQFGVTVTPLRTLAIGAEVMQIDPGVANSDVRALVATLSQSPAVQYAIEDVLLQPALTPNDTSYSQQWNYFEEAAGINLPLAWDVSSGAGVKIAVLDSGYRPHRDLLANVVGGYDFISDPFIAGDGDGRDANPLDPGDAVQADQCSPGSPPSLSTWHGTQISSIVGAVTNNGATMAGVAFGARIVPVRVIGRCGGLLSDVAEAAIWAAGGTVSGVPVNANPAKVLNLSLGAPVSCNEFAQATIDAVRALGATVVAAAGNSNSDAKVSLPANCAGVITVAALARSGGKASYSNFGDLVDLAAPGGDVVDFFRANGVLVLKDLGTDVPAGDSSGFHRGTSLAAAHVSGVVGLMLARNATLPPDKVEDVLKSTARAFAAPALCGQCGAGIVNARAAVSVVTLAPVPPVVPIPD